MNAEHKRMTQLLQVLKQEDISPFMNTQELPSCSLTDIQYFFCRGRNTPRSIDVAYLDDSAAKGKYKGSYAEFIKDLIFCFQNIAIYTLTGSDLNRRAENILLLLKKEAEEKLTMSAPEIQVKTAPPALPVVAPSIVRGPAPTPVLTPVPMPALPVTDFRPKLKVAFMLRDLREKYPLQFIEQILRKHNLVENRPQREQLEVNLDNLTEESMRDITASYENYI